MPGDGTPAGPTADRERARHGNRADRGRWDVRVLRFAGARSWEDVLGSFIGQGGEILNAVSENRADTISETRECALFPVFPATSKKTPPRNLRSFLLNDNTPGASFRDRNRQRAAAQLRLQRPISEIESKSKPQLVVVLWRGWIRRAGGNTSSRSDGQIRNIDIKIDAGRVGARDMHDQFYRIYLLLIMIARLTENGASGLVVRTAGFRHAGLRIDRGALGHRGLHEFTHWGEGGYEA